MSDNGRDEVLFPAGTIGRSMFEDMWPRHEGMPDLNELVEAAENATEEERSNGTWDDKLWDVATLQKMRAESVMTPRQRALIEIGEAVLGVIRMARALEDDGSRGDGGPDPEDDDDGVEFEAPPHSEHWTAVGALQEALWPTKSKTVSREPGRGDWRAILGRTQVVPELPGVDSVGARAGVAEALDHIGPTEFVSILWRCGYGADTAGSRESDGYAYYYALRIAAGLDRADEQPWHVISAMEDLKAEFARHAPAAHAANCHCRPEVTPVPEWYTFAETFGDRFDGPVRAALRALPPMLFAHMLAGDMLAKGDPYAEQARVYAWHLAAHVTGAVQRRLARSAVPGLDKVVIRPPTSEEVEQLRRAADEEEHNSPYQERRPVLFEDDEDENEDDAGPRAFDDAENIDPHAVRLRAAAAIATAAKAEGEIWVGLFLKAADAIFGPAGFDDVRRDRGSNWFLGVLGEEAVPYDTAVGAWDAAERARQNEP